jgi:preprotein translocase subunit SecG
MSTLFTILAVLALVGSILITLVVLLQNSKGGGLASNFTAGNQTFGVRQTTDILEKITWGLAIFILVVSIVASFSYGKSESNLAERAGKDAKKTETVDEIDVNAADSLATIDSIAQTNAPA